MILCKSWYKGTYDYDSEQGTGPRFFLGGMAETENSPVLLIGCVEVVGGWLRFAHRSSPSRHAFRKACLPTTVEEYLHFDDRSDDPIMGVILHTDCPGWEWDVIGEVLARNEHFEYALAFGGIKRSGPDTVLKWLHRGQHGC